MCRLPGWEEKTARAVNDMRAANGRRPDPPHVSEAEGTDHRWLRRSYHR
jgi:hypothetical protein